MPQVIEGVKSNANELWSFKGTESFLEKEIEFDFGSVDTEEDELVRRICLAELGLIAFNSKKSDTSNSGAFRVRQYRSNRDRIGLRETIARELITMERLDDDNAIELGSGGALPKSPIFERQAYIIMGLPASGKSSVATTVADNLSAAILDADYAKRKLPEYQGMPFGASIVHEESSDIVFGAAIDYITVIQGLANLGINLVIPKVGSSVKSIKKLAREVASFDYRVHITLVRCGPKVSAARAIKRYIETGRYVPPSLIYFNYANNVESSFLSLKTDSGDLFASSGIIDTSNRPNIAVEYTDGNPAETFMDD